MLIDRFKNNLAKASRGGQMLHDHVMDCVKVAHRVLTDRRFTPDGYDRQKRDQLLFATFIHDVGKLDPEFQAVIHAARNGESLPPKRIKHEASTLDFEQLVLAAQDEVRQCLRDSLGYQLMGPLDLEESLAFAVTHHGLFYLSFEIREGLEEPIKRIRREWTVFNYGEKRRITLTDLLFDYHPLGGLVIIADLLASFCYECGIAGADGFIGRAQSLRKLIDIVLREGGVETVERSNNSYDPRTYGLRDLLTLLVGGLA